MKISSVVPDIEESVVFQNFLKLFLEYLSENALLHEVFTILRSGYFATLSFCNILESINGLFLVFLFYLLEQKYKNNFQPDILYTSPCPFDKDVCH